MADIDLTELTTLASEIESSVNRVAGLAETAVRKFGADMEAAGKTGAPVRTGFLRNSITASEPRWYGTASVEVEVGPEANYGKFVHDGTIHMAPRPFMADGFDRTIEATLDTIGAIGEEAL